MVSPGRRAGGARNDAARAGSRVVEVGPRDGLQNEAAALTVDDRVAFCAGACSTPGCPWSRSGAFVSPKWVPQMAGSDEVYRRLRRRAGRAPARARPEPQGVRGRRAPPACARSRSSPRPARPSTARTSTRRIDESFARFARVRARGAARTGMWVRGYVSTCFGCPYEGAVDPARVVEVARRLADARLPRGLDRRHHRRGRAHPGDGRDGPAAGGGARGRRWPSTSTTPAAPRSPTCWPRCRRASPIVDSSAGGLGGCPYAPGASGNLATEDLLYMLHGMGIETGVDLEKVAAASRALGAPPRPRPAQPLSPGHRPGFDTPGTRLLE